jgi:hypothetical protein
MQGNMLRSSGMPNRVFRVQLLDSEMHWVAHVVTVRGPPKDRLKRICARQFMLPAVPLCRTLLARNPVPGSAERSMQRELRAFGHPRLQTRPQVRKCASFGQPSTCLTPRVASHLYPAAVSKGVTFLYMKLHVGLPCSSTSVPRQGPAGGKEYELLSHCLYYRLPVTARQVPGN